MHVHVRTYVPNTVPSMLHVMFCAWRISTGKKEQLLQLSVTCTRRYMYITCHEDRASCMFHESTVACSKGMQIQVVHVPNIVMPINSQWEQTGPQGPTLEQSSRPVYTYMYVDMHAY